MAESYTIIGNEEDWRTAGKPALIAGNAVISAQWTAGGAATETATTDPEYPAKRVYDRHLHLTTKAETVGATAYLNLFLDTSTHWDSVMIGGHTIPLGAQVYVEIADVPSFSENLQAAYFPPTRTANGWRLLNIGSERFVGYPYARIRIPGVSGPVEIGEVVFGRRYQLSRHSRRPYDDYELASDITEFRSKSGVSVRVRRSAGQRRVRAVINPSLEVDTIRAWFEATRFGVDPTIWVDDASTLVGGTQRGAPYWMRPPMSLSMPVPQGRYIARDWTLELEEIAPYVSGEL